MSSMGLWDRVSACSTQLPFSPNTPASFWTKSLQGRGGRICPELSPKSPAPGCPPYFLCACLPRSIMLEVPMVEKQLGADQGGFSLRSLWELKGGATSCIPYLRAFCTPRGCAEARPRFRILRPEQPHPAWKLVGHDVCCGRKVSCRDMRG